MFSFILQISGTESLKLLLAYSICRHCSPTPQVDAQLRVREDLLRALAENPKLPAIDFRVLLGADLSTPTSLFDLLKADLHDETLNPICDLLPL